MRDHLLQLLSARPVRQFATGDDILVEGEKAGVLFVLKEGSVEILKGESVIARVGSPGAILGEISILLDRPHMATVRALAPTTLHAIENPEAFLTAHPEVNTEISRVLATRLDLMTNYLADLKQQFAEESSHLGIIDEVLATLTMHQR